MRVYVAFMGHGNPEGYDYYGGNIRYLQLEDALRAINKNYYVGTVDMADTYAEDVLEHIGGGEFDYQVGAMGKTTNYEKNNAKKAQLFVLMSIAGDHAHNDMADEEDPESWVSLFNAGWYTRQLPMKPTSPRLAGRTPLRLRLMDISQVLAERSKFVPFG